MFISIDSEKAPDKIQHPGASLVAQWLRIRLPMQGTQVRALGSGKIPHAAEQLSPCATTTEARMPRVRALQQEKTPQ